MPRQVLPQAQILSRISRETRECLRTRVCVPRHHPPHALVRIPREARENLRRWNLASRVAIEVGDVRARVPEPAFELATLPNNIYYFPVEARVEALRHVAGFLRPGGRLLLTTICLGKGAAVDVLNLWAAMTDGCGRLPEPREMVAQLEDAGYTAVVPRSLIPSDSFYSFVAVRPA